MSNIQENEDGSKSIKLTKFQQQQLIAKYKARVTIEGQAVKALEDEQGMAALIVDAAGEDPEGAEMAMNEDFSILTIKMNPLKFDLTKEPKATPAK